MNRSVRVVIEGKPVEIARGTTAAAAALNAGVIAFRTSVRGEPRAPLCAMGVCFECRLTIDGVPHERSCLVKCTDGMRIDPCEAAMSHESQSRAVRREVDVAVVGAGPAGIAAAVAARSGGASVCLVDQSHAPGGQIWRPALDEELPKSARNWLGKLEKSGAELMLGWSVVDVLPGRVLALTRSSGADGSRVELAARKVILASGARELFLPFEGWTLPGVVGVGGLQLLLKSGMRVRGARVVVAGSGPLLLPAAARARKMGAKLVMLAEQARAGSLAAFGAGLAVQPGRAAAAVGYGLSIAKPVRTGWWVESAHGSGRLTGVTVTNGHVRRSISCDWLACAWGLVPNVELAALFGCAVENGAIVVDENQYCSAEGVLAAGECTGVGGEALAIAEGWIAGAAAVGAPISRQVLRRRRREHAFAARLARAFKPRQEVRSLAQADTVICRCEDVDSGRLQPDWDARAAKLYSRVGMGACQGRICGAALACTRGMIPGTVRAPAYPATVASLALQADDRTVPDDDL